MRRAGELVAVRPAGSQEWLFPAWQFGPDGQVRPEVARVLEAARKHGLRPERLTRTARAAKRHDRRRTPPRRPRSTGRIEHVLATIEAA